MHNGSADELQVLGACRRAARESPLSDQQLPALRGAAAATYGHHFKHQGVLCTCWQ